MTTWEERVTRRPEPEPRLERLETCWQFLSPSGRTLTCGIYAIGAPGVEVRVGYSEEGLLYSHVSVEIGPARELAGEPRQTVIDKGGFTELPSKES